MPSISGAKEAAKASVIGVTESALAVREQVMSDGRVQKAKELASAYKEQVLVRSTSYREQVLAGSSRPHTLVAQGLLR
jgi:hypothetical protein